MEELEKTLIDLLKGDTTAEAAAKALGLSKAQLADRRRRYLRRKLPKTSGDQRTPGLDGPVEILRDTWGVAHIEAKCVADGFFGLGYAMAQDRLWQLDHMRRLASGRLAEILGAKYVDQDRVHRTIGLRRSAEAAVAASGDDVRLVLDSLSAGINAHIADCRHLPVEFDLLDYAPEPWSPVDSVVVWKWRWWMLTGRLNILAVAEAGRKHLSAEHFEAFMTCEVNEETIVPGDGPAETGGHDTGEGSNNWVVGGSLTDNGKPILATDPHNSVDLARQWYQAQLTIPGLDAIGAFFLGTPGIYLGHTRHTAWGVTNHTASARDVYVESESAILPDAPKETIAVSGGADVELEIRSTERGPLIQSYVPGVDLSETPLLSLKWEGSEATTGFESMMSLLRSTSQDDVLAALKAWPFPILNFVFADDAGRIGYHAAGHVPNRPVVQHGFRDAEDPDARWDGNYAFEDMPRLVDPDQDWVATANNPPWGGDRPYLHLGAWSDGYRFRRIRQRIAAESLHTITSVGAIQADTVHGRAEDLAPVVAEVASRGPNKAIRELGDILSGWDGAYDVDEIAPTVFTAFWEAWLARVAKAQFPETVVSLVKDRCADVARRVILGNGIGWFDDTVNLEKEVIGALRDADRWLRNHIGSRKSQWRWGRLHTVTFDHPCATSLELEKLLNVGPFETSGVTGTVRAASHSLAEPFKVTGLSTYRMVVDLAKPSRAHATSAGGQSGHPASPNYRTQSELWLKDDTHPLLMDRKDIERNLEGHLTLVP